MPELESIRRLIRTSHLLNDAKVIESQLTGSAITTDQRNQFCTDAASLINLIRNDNNPGLMEVFLAEYGLSTDEGIALMCLAEALLRVPDAETIDDLIEDKIAPSSWGKHLGKSSSSLVNASTWGLMLTGKVLDDDNTAGVARLLHGAVKRLGEPLIRSAVKRAMQEMGNQFVLGETIAAATKRSQELEDRGFSYSYDMLGEAALTAGDAKKYYEAYENSIIELGKTARSGDIRENPGISIKLSALHPRYEAGQRDRVITELTQSTLALATLAKKSNMGFNIDAEESDRLDLSLDIIEAVLSNHSLSGWDGFGVVVQAYGKRASLVIDWLYTLSRNLDRKIMIRLVKGAYWDTEIKRSQVEGLPHFPVFSRKSLTDISYICCAEKLLSMTDRIYPQFATHNAHSVSAVLTLANDKALNKSAFEFQRLHGMGEVLHRQVMEQHGTRCRIYAPVGAHRDLLAYLVRRLLENGANSSFVNQIVDQSLPAEEIATDPFLILEQSSDTQPQQASDQKMLHFSLPADIYKPQRKNSRGWDLHDTNDILEIESARLRFATLNWHAKPIIAGSITAQQSIPIINPANPDDQVGSVIEASIDDVKLALSKAKVWSDAEIQTKSSKKNNSSRAEILNKAADLYEENYGEIFAVLIREAGKTPADAIAELREAVDFLRYYATRIDGLGTRIPRGIISSISPWNFPLAIFTGQIAAALAAGNAVLAKPAESTPLIASVAIKLMHQAGVPVETLQLLPGQGSIVGQQLVSDNRVNGVCFTGSTSTAQSINRTMSENLTADALLIAETGGLNAMIVDSTALPEQAVRDIITSAFQSAGQRCSALRLLYLQEDIASDFIKMLTGAMDELNVADPWLLSTDIGPVINKSALTGIASYIEKARDEGRLVKQLQAPEDGLFVGPAIVKVNGVEELEREIFGPVLHLTTFKAEHLQDIVSSINSREYGLTFGLHTRIDDRVEHMVSQLNVGNIYINRNQIGAIVGSQPFGGEGLSGTGPKAGGPHYVERFTLKDKGFNLFHKPPRGLAVDAHELQYRLDRLPETTRIPLKTINLPGPTGESNRLSIFPKGTILCLGPTIEDANEQVRIAASEGCNTFVVCPDAQIANSINGHLKRSDLSGLNNISAVVLWGDNKDQIQARIALAQRGGSIIQLICNHDFAEQCTLERHVCIDTTAAGGNTRLLSQGDS